MASGRKAQQDIEKHIIGTCLAMCPNTELRLRQREGLLHPLERRVDPKGGTGCAEPRAMVKEFSRSAAGHHIKPSDVRPLPILVKTTKYLLTNVCCREDVSWALVYQFVYDRLRAVRQDLCVQGIRVAGLGILQAAVRFYVYAQYRTCEHELSDFDPYLNMKHLVETLSLVITLYQESDKERTEVKLRSVCSGEDTSFTQCDVCDKSSDESSCSNDSDSDDVNERKITQDAVANEKKDSAGSRGESESEGSDTNLSRIVTEQEQGERSENHGESSSDPCNNSTTTSSASGEKDKEQEKPMEREEEQRKAKETDREEQQRRAKEKDREEKQKREKKWEKLKSEMQKYTPREEAEALNLLVNFGKEEAIMHILKLPPEMRESRLVWTATQMNLAWLNSNYYRVLRFAPLLPPICLVAFHYHLTTIQRQALSILSMGHSSRSGLMYNGEDLTASLKFPSITKLFDACTHYGLTTTDTGVIFTKASFNHETPLMKPSRTGWIDEQLASVSVGDLLLPSSQDLSGWLAG